MLYFLAHVFDLRFFSYISVRAIMATLTALIFSLIMGPYLIRYLVSRQIGQVVRDLGPQSHFSKRGTPTMGGSLILLSITISVLLWGDLSNYYLWVVLLVSLLFGAIGWVDDYRKLILKDSAGLRAKWKYLLQSLFAGLAIAYIYRFHHSELPTWPVIPFMKSLSGELGVGIGFIILAYFVIVGTSNAVNLTDGLDGLAILPIVLVGGALGLMAYVTGNHQTAKYLDLHFIDGAGEIVIYCGALVGAGLGFLWFNAYPAQVFMGDVGALGLGAALGAIAILIRQEVALFIMGGVFVAETFSVILQVGSFKLRGKRIFKMAPIHHHFELKGWPEPRVIVRFWIITVILVLLGLVTLKLR